jgi:hypothetical protein
MNTSYVFGFVPIQTLSQGDWSLSAFDVSESEANFHNLRCDINRRYSQRIAPGCYMQLKHQRRGIVMSNTPMEVLTNRVAYRMARGKVLINGLGLGMLLDGVLRKPEVDSVRVIEVDPDVIALVGPRFADNPKCEIIQADAFAYSPGRGEVFDYVWHDIWDDISASNLEQMKKLVWKYRKPRALAQGVWSRDLIS